MGTTSASSADARKHRRRGRGPARETASAPERAPRTVWLAVLVALVAAGVAARSVTFDLVWDDRFFVIESPATRSPGGLAAALTRDYFDTRPPSRVDDAEAGLRYGYYRPVSMASFALTRWVAGASPRPYHVTNVVVHAAVAVLVLLLGLALGAPRTAALAAALLFAVHPAHVEAVCWVSGRTDLLAALLGLGGVVLWLRAPGLRSTRGRVVAWGLAAALIALAALAKEVALALPLCLVALGRADPERPAPWRRLAVSLAPLAALVGAYAAFRLAAVDLPGAELPGTTVGERVASALAGVARYTALFVAPLEQRPYLQVPMTSSLWSGWALAGLALVAASAAIWLRRGRSPGSWRAAALAACALFALVPALNLVRITSPADMGFTMAERFLYLPSAFLCLLCGEGFAWSLERARAKVGARGGWAVAAAGLVVAALLGWASWARALTWRDELSLFGRMTATAPQAPLPAVLRSQALRRAGRAREAEDEAAAARRLYLDQGARPPPAIDVTVAGALAARGRLGEAAELLEAPAVQALGSPAVHRDLATVYRLQRRLDAAAAQLERALALDPEDPRTLVSLALLRLQQGQLDRAREAAERARDLSPDDPAAGHALALVARASGDFELAERELRALLEAGNQDVRVEVDLGVVLSEQGRHEEAVAFLRRAQERALGSSQVRHALAVALLRAGEIDEGARLLEVGGGPRDADALLTLARAHLARGDRAAARRALDEAAAIAPTDARVEPLRRELGDE